MRRMRAGRRSFLSACALIAAVSLLCITSFRVMVDPQPLPPVQPDPVPMSRDVDPGLREEALRLAAERNPFDPDRDGTNDARRSAEIEAPAERYEVVVLGTVVLSEHRGVAMLQQEGGPARLVRTGETLGDITVEQIAPGSVVLRGPDGAARTLPVKKR